MRDDEQAMPYAVVYDRDDVEALDPAMEAKIVALTPAAGKCARDNGHVVVDGNEFFGDEEQGRIADRLSELRARIDEALRQHGRAEAEVIRARFDQIMFSLMRIEETVRNVGPCAVHAQGRWHRGDETECIAALQTELLDRQSPRWRQGFPKYDPPPVPALFRGLVRCLATLVRRRSARGRVVSGALKTTGGLPSEVVRAGGRIIVVTGTRGSFFDYLALFKQYLNAFSDSDSVSIPIFGAVGKTNASYYRDVADAVDEPLLQHAATRIDALLSAQLGGVSDARTELLELFRILAPTSYLSSEISRLTDYLCAECAGVQGIPRVVLGRNAQVPSNDEKAITFKSSYLTSRYPPGLVDIALFWNDFGIRAGKQFLDPAVEIGAIAYDPPNNAETTRIASDQPIVPSKRRKILIADTFGVWWTPLWWGIQTSDEYLLGLEKLAEALEGLADLELVIRHKDKFECDSAVVAARTNRFAQVRIEGREKPFAESLEEADLMVGFFSTTIHEAVAAGCPVFLFGGTDRHHYLPARCSPPTVSDRAAIYGCDEDTDLAALVTAILDAHAGRPLTPVERAHFMPDPGAPSVADIGGALAKGALPYVLDPHMERLAS